MEKRGINHGSTKMDKGNKIEKPKDQLGMILVHNGIVRATSKEGKPVEGMSFI